MLGERGHFSVCRRSHFRFRASDDSTSREQTTRKRASCPFAHRSCPVVGAWDPIYTDAQRTAIVYAAVELRIRPYRKIKELAAAGQLRPDEDADPVPPFHIPEATISDMKVNAERRRAGHHLRGELAKLPARDRAEQLQRRLTGVIDHELERLERIQRYKPKAELNARQAMNVAKAIRELATLPDPHEKRLPRTRGEQEAGEQHGTPTQDSLAGKLLRASDASQAPSRRDTAAIEPATQPETSSTTTIEPADEPDGLPADGVLVGQTPHNQGG